MTKRISITPATAFVSGALVPMAVPAAELAAARGLVAYTRNDQDATAGFSAWSPPV
jgi:hypothetical protein